MALPEPTIEEHERMRVSQSARQDRRAQRIGERTLASIGRDQGRKRTEIGSPDQLPLYGEPVLGSDVVIKLGKVLKDKQPVLDKFTNHHRIAPTAEAIELYVSAGNRKRVVTKSADHDEQRQIFRSMQRQSMHQADLLQQEVFDDLVTAQLRRACLRTIQYQVRNGKELDKKAAMFAADALIDFGDSLSANRDILREVHNEGLGETIAYIGATATDDPETLRSNPELLRLVQIEQKERVELWRPIYEATKVHIPGNRLTPEQLEQQNSLPAELARLDALCQA